jgi:shikimate kinase
MLTHSTSRPPSPCLRSGTAGQAFQLSILAAYSRVNSAKSIVLIGFMGAGKSSVGRCLERRIGLARIDTDEVVSAKFGLSIPEIFSRHGEEQFREAETEALRQISPDRQSIIVTGGGIVLRQENVDLLKRVGKIVWLDADEEKLFERASRRGGRPLLQTETPRKTFSDLLQKRKPLYAMAADIRVDTASLTHDDVADVILNEIGRARPSVAPKVDGPGGPCLL